MRKNPVDPGQSDRPDPASPRHLGVRNLRARFTPARLAMGVLVLTLLTISVVSSLIVPARSSYANTAAVLDVCATATSTATAVSTAPGGIIPTPTPKKQKTVTPTPMPTDTPTPVTPTPTDTTTPTPTDTTTPTPTGTTSAGNIVNPGANGMVMFSARVQCSPTAAATGGTSTPGTTPTSAPITSGGNPNTPATPNNQPGGGGGSQVVVIVGGVLLLLLFGLGIGWLFFRRMLLPVGVPNVNLRPSGARPWARTRVPNPDSIGGFAGVQGAAIAMNGAPGNFGPGGPGNFGPGGPGGSGPNMFAGPGNVPAGPPMMNGYNGPAPAGFGPPGGNGASFGGFSDNFIPPSPQIFPQGESSMIPPGSGAFPVITGTNGFAPASQAFNAMYGLPDDPFAGSQAGSPGWMANLGNGNSNNGFGAPQSPSGGNFTSGIVDLNDPQLAEVIRQYSQKSQSVQSQPQQMSPGSEPAQPTQQMPLNGPPQQMSPNGLPPQNPPGPQIPQREPRQGFQDSNWLQ